MDELTNREKELLEDALRGYCDEGAEGSGWKSEEFEALVIKILKAFNIDY